MSSEKESGDFPGSRLTDSCRNVIVKITRGTSLIEVTTLFVYSRYEHSDSRWPRPGSLRTNLHQRKLSKQCFTRKFLKGEVTRKGSPATYPQLEQPTDPHRLEIQR
jgi:hypothetical protein